MSSPRASRETNGRAARIRQVLEECLRQRAAGQPSSDEQIIAAHGDLMPELAQELKLLTVLYRATDEARGDSTVLTVSPRDNGTSRAVPPDLFPGYRIVREIHRGGQGVVYETRHVSTGRAVAIKVMKEGPFAGPGDRARFEREVRILGQLKHPNIVTVYDSGRAADYFYFVMDYVAGAPLDQWISDSGPGILASTAGDGHAPKQSKIQNPKSKIDAALRLFAKICDAVNAAHLHGILHRDLKPGNILVGPDGEPYVLDFGLAKQALAEERGGAAQSATTIAGQFIGSLPWASPEQAEGLPDIDLRTDVYSLGVVLYQILTGAFPYKISGTMREALEQIHQAVPTRPRALRPELNDEIETIILKCLQKERDRRYQTAGELARDIRRYLAHEPLEAKRDSRWYVLRKTLRRHWVAASVAAAFVLLISSATIALAFLYRNQAQERRRAEDALGVADQARRAEALQRAVAQKRAEEAKAQAAKAQAVKQFLKNMLAAADPLKTKGRDFTVREALDEAARKIQAGPLAAEPLVEAEARETIAASYEALGLYGAALPHRQWLLDFWTRRHGVEHAETLEALRGLADAYQGLGRLSDALPLYEQTLTVTERLFGENHADTINALLGVGDARTRAGRADEAEPYYQRALAAAECLFGEEDLLTARALWGLAVVYRDQGKTQAAEPFYRRALATHEKLAEPESIATIRLRWGLARDVLAAQGNYQEAETVLRETLAFACDRFGPDHPECIVLTALLGDLLGQQRKYEEAELLLCDAQARARNIRGGQHTEVFQTAQYLSRLLFETHRPAEAAAVLQDGLARARESGAEQTLLLMLTDGARNLSSAGDYAAAEKCLREALDIQRRLAGANPAGLAGSLRWFGHVCYDQFQYEKAAQAYRQALELDRENRGEIDAKTLDTLFWLGRAACFAGDSGTALALAREMDAELRAAPDADPALLDRSAEILGDVLYHAARFDETERLDRERIALVQRRQGARALETAHAYGRCGDHRLAAGDLMGARAVLQEAAAIYAEQGQTDASEAVGAQNSLCAVLLELGEAEQSERVARQTLNRVRAKFGPYSLETLQAQCNVGRAMLAQNRTAEAEPLLRECVQRLRALRWSPQRAEQTFMMQVTLAECLLTLDCPEETEDLLREALELQRVARTVFPWKLAVAKSLLGANLAARGRFAEAETWLLEADLVLNESPFAAARAKRESLARLVRLYEQWGRPKEAAEYRERAGGRER